MISSARPRIDGKAECLGGLQIDETSGHSMISGKTSELSGRAIAIHLSRDPPPAPASSHGYQTLDLSRLGYQRILDGLPLQDEVPKA
jgi:hypothetical protein